MCKHLCQGYTQDVDREWFLASCKAAATGYPISRIAEPDLMVYQVEACVMFSKLPEVDQQRKMACLQQVVAAVCPEALVYLKH